MPDQPDPAQWPMIFTALTSVLALAISLWSVHTARHSLKVSTTQLDAQRPSLDLYLHTGYIHTRPSQKSRIFSLSLSVSNLSDSDNSISLLELGIHHHSPEGIPMQSLLPHAPQLAEEQGDLAKITPLQLPTDIRAHQTIAGWVLFDVPAPLFKDTIVDSHVLVATDTHKLQYIVEVSQLMEIMDEKETS